jgi:hypothetical protein
VASLSQEGCSFRFSALDLHNRGGPERPHLDIRVVGIAPSRIRIGNHSFWSGIVPVPRRKTSFGRAVSIGVFFGLLVSSTAALYGIVVRRFPVLSELLSYGPEDFTDAQAKNYYDQHQETLVALVQLISQCEGKGREGKGREGKGREGKDIDLSRWPRSFHYWRRGEVPIDGGNFHAVEIRKHLVGQRQRC